MEPPPTTLNSANETWVQALTATPAAPPPEAAPPAAPPPEAPAPEAPAPAAQLPEIVSGDQRYVKAPYAPPELGSFYSVRDKVKGERIIRIVSVSPEGDLVQIEILEPGKSPKPPVQLTVDSLARQAAKGWCSLLIPVAENEKISPLASKEADTHFRYVTMRLDSQNFSRCCSDIVRAKLKFDTQAIKDVQDGPFRAGNYEQAFLVFEQIAVGFNSAVANGRREISEGRRLLGTQKYKLSGKEVLERMAAFLRSENLIQTAEREFSTILEGLRMYLRVLAASENQTEA
jgi:hypothetical protein